MDITFAAIIFASRTIPTDFGLVAAAIAGAGSLLFIALRFVPDAGNLVFPFLRCANLLAHLND